MNSYFVRLTFFYYSNKSWKKLIWRRGLALVASFRLYKENSNRWKDLIKKNTIIKPPVSKYQATFIILQRRSPIRGINSNFELSNQRWLNYPKKRNCNDLCRGGSSNINKQIVGIFIRMVVNKMASPLT